MITWTVGILVGLPVYLMVGYLLGKITVKEFQNDTPLKELSLWGKIKRRVLFPYIGQSFENWRRRYEYYRRPFSWGEFGFISNCELNIRRYLKVISFYWPFKIFPFVTGSIILIFSFLFGVLEFFCNKLEQVFSRISDFTDKSDFSDKSILRLKAFRDKEIQKRKENLEETLARHKGQIQSLEMLINNWDGLIEKVGDNNSQKERFSAMRAKLLEEKKAMERESVKITKAIAVILENGKELDILIEALELYSRSRNLTIKENIPLVKEQVEEMLSAADAAMIGVKEAYSIELDLMAKSGAEVEDMAQQFVESKQQSAKFSQEKLEAMRKCAGALSSIRARI